MFGFLKDKLKNIVSGFSKKVEAEEKEKIEEPMPDERVVAEKKPEEKKAETKKEKPKEEAVTEEVKKEISKPELVEEKRGFFGKLREKFSAKEKPEEPKKVAELERAGEKQGFVSRIAEKITKTTISNDKFEELFSELEIALLENNVAVEVIDRLKEDLKKQLLNRPLDRSGIQRAINRSLRDSIENLFITKQIDLVQRAKEKKPLIILFLGINGSGKTTTIAKVAKLLANSGLKSVIAASDTFRAAAIQQLEIHADKLGIKLIKHDYGADPAAVAFDAIKYAEAHRLDAVLVDTAGRLHSNINLMDEMKKIVRVAKPDIKVFVGESITGNDCVEQARSFNEAIGIDAIILAKADVDEKGGAAISISYVTGKPIIFLGTGQGYGDLQPFSPEIIVDSLGLGA